jgi:hypothetical protein
MTFVERYDGKESEKWWERMMEDYGRGNALYKQFRLGISPGNFFPSNDGRRPRRHATDSPTGRTAADPVIALCPPPMHVFTFVSLSLSRCVETLGALRSTDAKSENVVHESLRSI